MVRQLGTDDIPAEDDIGTPSRKARAENKKAGRRKGDVSSPPSCPAGGARWCRATPTFAQVASPARFGGDIERPSMMGLLWRLYGSGLSATGVEYLKHTEYLAI